MKSSPVSWVPGWNCHKPVRDAAGIEVDAYDLIKVIDRLHFDHARPESGGQIKWPEVVPCLEKVVLHSGRVPVSTENLLAVVDLDEERLLGC